MIRVMHEEHDFSDLFLKFLLARSMRIQADLVDQLFNSSEKRLARILLLMAEFGKPGEPETLIPKISQETLAEMIGTTRSRVSFFMNRFRKLGFIEYNGRIRVHKSLLNVVLHDQLPDDYAEDRLAMRRDEYDLKPPASRRDAHCRIDQLYIYIHGTLAPYPVCIPARSEVDDARCKKTRLLIVDDEPSIRTSLLYLLPRLAMRFDQRKMGSPHWSKFAMRFPIFFSPISICRACPALSSFQWFVADFLRSR